MRNLLIVTAFSAVLGLGSAAQAQFSLDVHIGPPPPAPRAYRVPPQPGPDYEWVDGYWYPVGRHYVWHNGYWTRPPYAGAYWVEPYYWGGLYYAGHWEGDRGRVNHDHRWDRTRQHDERR
jgi:WXXGXW repeat (2 copies)